MRRGATARGASPTGIEPGNEAAAARVVRQMFARVAPRYDFLNHLLSAQLDRRWRSRLVQAVRPYLAREGARVADLCCGTGDLTLAMAREHERLGLGSAPFYLACDFCRPMLSRAAAKMGKAGLPCVLAEADAARMPLPDACLDLITIAYGFRNLANYRRGAQEFARLLAPGGCLAVLEFSEPATRWWGVLYNLYFRHVLPKIGNAISGSGGAYSYLHESVVRFPEPVEICEILLEAGFGSVSTRALTGGVSVLYLAYK